METWISKKVGAASLRRAIAWGLAVAAGVLLLGANTRYYDNFARGPFALNKAALDSIHDVTTTPRYFARVAGERAIDTRIREYTTHSSAGVETSREVTGSYLALVLGDRFLIAKTGGVSATVAEGELEPLPPDLETNLFDSKEMLAIRPRFYPFYVNNESFRIRGYLGIAVALVLVFFGVRGVRSAWRHFREPAGHPLMPRIASWGGDPLGIAVEVERDSDTPRFAAGNGWKIGDKYLVQSTVFTFNLLRLTDLLWAYKKVTRHRVNLIPTGKSYEAVLVCSGGSAVMKAKERRVDEILAFAAQRAPWAAIGYSAELATLFAKDIRAFTAAVEARRR